MFTTTIGLIELLGSEIIVHLPLATEAFGIMDAEFEGEDAIDAALLAGLIVLTGHLATRTGRRRSAR